MTLTPTMLKILRLCASGTTRYYHPSINGRGMVTAKKALVERGLLAIGPERVGCDGFGIPMTERVTVTDDGRAALEASR